MKLKENDILMFKNGNTTQYSSNRDDFIISHYYDSNLNCISNREYDIIKVLRPTYVEIFNKEDEKNDTHYIKK